MLFFADLVFLWDFFVFFVVIVLFVFFFWKIIKKSLALLSFNESNLLFVLVVVCFVHIFSQLFKHILLLFICRVGRIVSMEFF